MRRAFVKWSALTKLRRYLIVCGSLTALVCLMGAVTYARFQLLALGNRPQQIKISGGLELEGCIWYSRNRLIGWFGRSDLPWSLEQLDLVSGRLEPLPFLQNMNYNVQASPDGQRFLAFSFDQPGRWVWNEHAQWMLSDPAHWLVTGLDGHPYEKRKPAASDYPWNTTWIPDSSAWMQMEPGPQNSTMYLYKIGSSKPDSDFKFLFPGYTRLIGFPDRSHVLVRSVNDTVDTYLLKDTAVLQRSLSFSRLFATSDQPILREVSLSPDCKRLCWLVLSPYKSRPAVLSELETAFPRIGDFLHDAPKPLSDPAVATFWTTSLDGTCKQCIAHVVLDKFPAVFLYIRGSHSSLGDNAPNRMAWSHDGDQITYCLNGKFWAINVPKE
ncbi:MAG: hypothetical protein JWL77_1024 [Chthonomonadaceae bacterium]|nr:hypothetical protein [Chthonomonadaceae bacterium]